MLEYHRITEEDKYTISTWKYDGEYSIYDEESYDKQKERGFGFANPKNNFFVFNDNQHIIGYINLYEEETEVFFGIGVNPIFCGKGFGQQMAKKAIELSRELFPGKPLYLEVRTWNKRAVRCYQKAGFRIVGAPIVQTTHIGEGVFYHMVTE